MRRFWGCGAIVALALLGVVTVSSYAAGAHLGLPAEVAGISAPHVAGAQATGNGTAPSGTNASPATSSGPAGAPAPGSRGAGGPKGRGGPKGQAPAQ